MSHRTAPTHLTTAALIIAITSAALAAERHHAVKTLQRRLGRQDAHTAAHAYALGVLHAEGRTRA